MNIIALRFASILTGQTEITPTGSVVTIDKLIINFFNNLFNGNGWGNFILVFLGLLLCTILVGIIGYQREVQGHNAGLRTHILVGVGSCMIMIISMYAIGYADEKYETMRLAASVATGIGFLGGGVIIKNKTSIKGLTTAATLWVSMAIGLACGSGNFTIALLGAFSSYLCLFVFNKFEIHASKANPKLYIILPEDSTISFKDILKEMEVYSYSIKDAKLEYINYENKKAVKISLDFIYAQKEGLELIKRDLELAFHPYSVGYVVSTGKDKPKLPD